MFLKNKLDVERRGREEEEEEAQRIASYAGDAARTIENEQRKARGTSANKERGGTVPERCVALHQTSGGIWWRDNSAC